MLIRQVRVPVRLCGLWMEPLNNDGTKITPEVSMWLGSGASYFVILAFILCFFSSSMK